VTCLQIFESTNKKFVETVPDMGKDFSDNNNYVDYGLCEKVCPVINIEMVNNQPQYRHHCEQCVSCIQDCPQSNKLRRCNTKQKKIYKPRNKLR
jgi:ferredoxin